MSTDSSRISGSFERESSILYSLSFMLLICSAVEYVKFEFCSARDFISSFREFSNKKQTRNKFETIIIERMETKRRAFRLEKSFFCI